MLLEAEGGEFESYPKSFFTFYVDSLKILPELNERKEL